MKDQQVRTPVSILRDKRMREALEYWRKQAGDRAMPRRADFDPFEVPKALPYMRMLEVLGPRQYRFRLVGTRAQTPNFSLRSGDEHIPAFFPPELREYILTTYDEIAREKRPLYYETSFALPIPGHQPTMGLILDLPFSDDGITPNVFITIQILTHLDAVDLPEPGECYKERLRVLM